MAAACSNVLKVATKEKLLQQAVDSVKKLLLVWLLV